MPAPYETKVSSAALVLQDKVGAVCNRTIGVN